MPITFNCPCGKILASKERDAGLPAVCPHCGRRVVVPGERAPEPDAAAEFRKTAGRIEDWLFGHQRHIWIGVAVLVVLFVAASIAYVKLRPSSRDARSSDGETAQSAAGPAVVLDENADPKAWRTSFDSFAVAVQKEIGDEMRLKSTFEGQEVEWTVTFQEALERTAIYFLEAEPLRNRPHGIAVWATILTREAPQAEKLQRGDKITLRGKIGSISTARSAEHPEGYTLIRPVDCVLIAD